MAASSSMTRMRGFIGLHRRVLDAPVGRRGPSRRVDADGAQRRGSSRARRDRTRARRPVRAPAVSRLEVGDRRHRPAVDFEDDVRRARCRRRRPGSCGSTRRHDHARARRRGSSIALRASSRSRSRTVRPSGLRRRRRATAARPVAGRAARVVVAPGRSASFTVTVHGPAVAQHVEADGRAGHAAPRPCESARRWWPPPRRRPR